MKFLKRQTEKERSLLDQKRALQVEQSRLSMVDNFASYSKLQRQINAIDQELTNQRSNRSYTSIKLNLFFTYGLKILLGVIIVVLSMYFRKEPVFVLSKKFDLSPFTKVISYPNEDNAVSFHFWVMCCSAVARLIPLST